MNEKARKKQYKNFSEKSKQTLKRNATEWTREKRKNGEIKSISLSGSDAEINIIRTAIKLHGGSNIKALVAICNEYNLKFEQPENDTV